MLRAPSFSYTRIPRVLVREYSLCGRDWFTVIDMGINLKFNFVSEISNVFCLSFLTFATLEK